MAMMTAGLHRAPAEVRRLRGDLAAARRQLAELARLVAAYFAADAGPLVSLRTARAWAAESYARGRTDGIDAGRLEVIAELKATDREVKAAFELEIKRWGPGGRTHFADPRPGDFAGMETTP